MVRVLRPGRGGSSDPAPLCSELVEFPVPRGLPELSLDSPQPRPVLQPTTPRLRLRTGKGRGRITDTATVPSHSRLLTGTGFAGQRWAPASAEEGREFADPHR